MILSETYNLSNGVKIPELGLGTWRIGDAQAGQVVRDAVKVGYRHFDTAQAYMNEQGVGRGLRDAGPARHELFLTTKIDAAHRTFETAKASIDRSLQALGLDYIDLMIIHSPQPWSQFREGDHFFEENLEVWRALEGAYGAGKLRAIGVSNFEATDLDNIIDNSKIPPMVNQILAHVTHTPFDLIDHSRNKGILVEAYSPVAHGAVLNATLLKEVASGYGVSVAQLCIRYCLQLGLLPLPKTVTPDHMRANAAVDFEISLSDMEFLNRAETIKDYGEANSFPVFGVRRQA